MPRYFRISDEGEILMQDVWVPAVVQQLPDDEDAERSVTQVWQQRAS